MCSKISAIIVVCVVSLFAFGCEEQLEDLIVDGLKDLSYSCNDSTSIYFFKGKFGKDSICLYENNYDCFTKFTQVLGGIVSTNPSIITGEDNYSTAKTWIAFGIDQWVKKNGVDNSGFVNKDHYYIQTVPLDADKDIPSLDSMVTALLVPGQSFMWNEQGYSFGIRGGFEVYISRYYYNPNYKDQDHWTIRMSSALGDQTGSYFEVLDVNTHEFENHVEGTIHVKFRCKIYLDHAEDLTGKFVDYFTGEVFVPISYDL
jgi:hypothetical protein